MALETLFNDICAAIHEKDGRDDGIAAMDFPARIRAIPSGGVQLESIAITAPPRRTKYIVGEAFDPAGMTVRAVWSNGKGMDIGHADLTFEPEGPLEEGTDAVTVRFQWGTETAEAVQPVSVALAVVYGASWDGSASTKWTRTDGAAALPACAPYVQGAAEYGSPFDNIMPWAGMVKEERAGGTMVAIPKFYYRLGRNADGGGLCIRISSAAADGFHVSPAHMDRGDGQGERDVVYIARYLCGGDFKSTTGAAAKTGITLAEGRAAIRALGSGMQHWDYAMRFTLWLLYLVEMADWDSQQCIGVGDNKTAGHTDAMPYHTGTMSISRASYGNGTQYRNIEGLWDCIGTFLDGAYFNASAETCILLNPADFLDTSKYDVRFKQESGYPTEFAIDTTAFPVFYPSKVGSSAGFDTYTCDTWLRSGANPLFQVGNRGGTSTRDRSGLFFNTFDALNYIDGSVGARSMELPDTASGR